MKLLKKIRQLKVLITMISVATLSIVIGMPASTLAATPATWISHPASDDLQAWRGVTWAPELGIFVSVGTGSSGTMTSPDGIHWTPRATPDALHTWRGVAWSPALHLFAAVGNGPDTTSVMTSPNGIDWTLRDPGVIGTYMGITWSPQQGKFVATQAPATGALTSTDGITWTPAAAPPAGARNVIWAAHDNQYVSARSPSASLYTSPDGNTWTQRNTPKNSFDIAYSETGDLYVAVGAMGIMTSNDAITWTAQTSPVTNLRAVEWSPENNEFAAVGAGGIVTSSDGITWTPATAPSANTWDAITWSPQLSRYVATSIDGTSRTMTGLAPTQPSAPINLAASSDGQKINLLWSTPVFDGNSAITGYRIERSVNGGAFDVLVATTNSPATTYSDRANITVGATYSYRIYALNAEGQSLVSNTATVRALDRLADTSVSQYGAGLLAGTLLFVGVIGFVKVRRISNLT